MCNSKGQRVNVCYLDFKVTEDDSSRWWNVKVKQHCSTGEVRARLDYYKKGWENEIVDTNQYSKQGGFGYNATS